MKKTVASAMDNFVHLISMCAAGVFVFIFFKPITTYFKADSLELKDMMISSLKCGAATLCLIAVSYIIVFIMSFSLISLIERNQQKRAKTKENCDEENRSDFNNFNNNVDNNN